MKPQELQELGYPSNIREMIEETEGVELIDEQMEHYLIHDTYDDADRLLQINKGSQFKESYFEFFSNEVNRTRLYEFARTLPPLLLMNLKKVYFVEQESDLIGEVDENSPNHTFHFDDTRKPLGMAIYNDSVAFVNLRQLKETAKEESEEDKRVLGYTNGFENYLHKAITETLAHELFHLAQFNPLIEEIMPFGEEPTEEFCRHYMGN